MADGQQLSTAEKWKKRLADTGKRLVFLETCKAVWNVCGIEQEDGRRLQISYMDSSGKRGGSFKVKREIIMQEDVRVIREYENV